MQSVAVVDVGSGNLRSVERALEEAARRANRRREIRVTRDADFIRRATKIVLPGQGAFVRCMEGLTREPGMAEALREAVLDRGAAFLGICVGMQILANEGHEFGTHQGLGWIGGTCRALSADGLRLPHMGWNDVSPVADHPVLGIAGVMYFAHSFVLDPPSSVLAQTTYGETFAAAVGRDNIVGVQFHPEKSQAAGLGLLARFLDWTP
jgi:imidazole glycerol-phosphate synthase subunit HisH